MIYIHKQKICAQINHLLGSSNAPQTFLVDKKGIIRYYHNGMLLDSIWQNEIYPIVEQLNAE